MARFEIGDLIGVLVNATPTFFWSVLHIYSDCELLRDLREEVDIALIKAFSAEDAQPQVQLGIDVSTLQDKCPLLSSTFREVLRHHTHHAVCRWVTEDTLLAGKYLLTKDSVVQVPGGVAHADPTTWGSDADSFNARRFLKLSEGGKTGRIPTGAYRAWGGGQTLCPGRFFAAIEIISALAMFIARFDLTPLEGHWPMPSEDSNRMAASIHPPSRDVKVRIRTREGLGQAHWEFLCADQAR